MLDSWKNGKSTEDSFADLATKKSDDEGSAETGGLIEDIYKNSNFVKPFIDWSYEKGRKVGDTGIIETVYGYHIMYCSKISTEPQWKTTILNEIVEEEYGSAVDKLIEERRKGIRVKDSRIGRIRKKIDKHAASIISRG
ncbi:MAG: peptidyl-prolyl cis-trans isomerase [Oscillospiraceae bacterium]|nr:peptidyl-prolyl cis-trans isomerase [Oscillospiraceae bacterium]